MDSLYESVDSLGFEDHIYEEIEEPLEASGNPYQWQLFDSKQWSRICHDHIIESHYCQPGAKGMTIYTHLGALHIDFDTLTIRGSFSNLAIKRLMFLPQNQTEEMGWYYRDNGCWGEYGSQGSSRHTSSVTSKDLEQNYNTNSKGSFQFTVGNTAYTIDFSAMTQTNLTTLMKRKVRRRPKFNSSPAVNESPLAFASPLPPPLPAARPSTGIIWEFMGEEGVWMEYQKPASSLDSVDIEAKYQQNPQGQVSFRAGRYTYTLHFNGMYQTNDRIGTKRVVRRSSSGNQQNSSSQTGIRWQYQDIDGSWTDYVKGSWRGACNVSSEDIEARYQQNNTGSMNFSTGKFNYHLDFAAMVQTNLSTNTKRPVRRL